MMELFALRWKSTSNEQNQSEVWGAEEQRQEGADVNQEVWERESKPQKDVKVLKIETWRSEDGKKQKHIPRGTYC